MLTRIKILPFCKANLEEKNPLITQTWHMNAYLQYVTNDNLVYIPVESKYILWATACLFKSLVYTIWLRYDVALFWSVLCFVP